MHHESHKQKKKLIKCWERITAKQIGSCTPCRRERRAAYTRGDVPNVNTSRSFVPFTAIAEDRMAKRWEWKITFRTFHRGYSGVGGGGKSARPSGPWNNRVCDHATSRQVSVWRRGWTRNFWQCEQNVLVCPLGNCFARCVKLRVFYVRTDIT
jgi:hypothetical protein